MNIQEILNKRGIQYVDHGSDYIVSCLSPDHADAHPSMRIDKVKGIFNCFSCNYTGNIFNHFGIERNLNHAKIIQIKEKIASKYPSKLHMPRGYDPFPQAYRGISKKTITQFQGFTHGDYPDRIVFPIRDIFGDIACFIGRYIASDATPKYKVFPENSVLPLFPASPEIVDGNIILVEGILDMLRLYDLGYKNVVTCFGVGFGSKRVADKINPLKLMGVTSLTVMFDGDKPGHDGALQVERQYSNDFLIFVRSLPKGKDPASMTPEEISDLI